MLLTGHYDGSEKINCYSSARYINRLTRLLSARSTGTTADGPNVMRAAVSSAGCYIWMLSIRADTLASCIYKGGSGMMVAAVLSQFSWYFSKDRSPAQSNSESATFSKVSSSIDDNPIASPASPPLDDRVAPVEQKPPARVRGGDSPDCFLRGLPELGHLPPLCVDTPVPPRSELPDTS